MPTKYQRALKDMKEGCTWQKIADELSNALGEVVYRSDVWNVANGRSSSIKVEKALELMEAVAMPPKRYRLAVDFDSERQRQDFRDFYGIDNDRMTFTDWVLGQWTIDSIRRNTSGNGHTSARRKEKR